MASMDERGQEAPGIGTRNPDAPAVGESGLWCGPKVSCTCLTVLEIPLLPESLHYRAYEERLAGESVLQWVIRRLLGVTGSRDNFVVLAAPTEVDHVRRALQGWAWVSLRPSSAAGHVADLNALVQERGPARVLLTRGSAALLPEAALRTFFDDHLRSDRHATILEGHPVPVPPVLVESDFLSTLASGIPGVPPDAVPRNLPLALEGIARAVEVLGTADQLRIATIAAFTAEEQARRRWPYKVLLDEADDVATLREALRRDVVCTTATNSAPEVLDHWTEMAGARRAQRLTPARPRRAPQATRHLTPRAILQVQVPSSFSGVEEVVALLAEGLAARRSEFRCSALVGLPGVFSQRLATVGAEVRIAYRDFSRSTLENYLFVRGELETVAPTILHAHTLAGAPVCFAAVDRGVPLVQHVHVATEEGLAILEDQIASASAVIAVSEFVRRCVLRLGVDPERVRVIHNGVRLRRAQPRDHRARLRTRQAIGVPEHAKVVLVPARLVPNKRHDVAVDGFALLRSRMPDAHLVLAGEAPPDNMTTLASVEAQVARLGVRGAVRFVGFWPDMASLYAASDVVLLPSEDEPLGLVVLEGMAAGVPAVGARSGGIPEIIDHRVSGLLTDVGDVDAVADAIQQILTDDELTSGYRLAGLEQVERRFSAARFVDQVSSLYGEVTAAGDLAIPEHHPVAHNGWRTH